METMDGCGARSELEMVNGASCTSTRSFVLVPFLCEVFDQSRLSPCRWADKLMLWMHRVRCGHESLIAQVRTKLLSLYE